MGVNYSAKLNKIQKALHVKGVLLEIDKKQIYSQEKGKHFNVYSVYEIKYDGEKKERSFLYNAYKTIDLYIYLGNKYKEVANNGKTT